VAFCHGFFMALRAGGCHTGDIERFYAKEQRVSVWQRWMDRALQAAALGEGRTSPNPLVGGGCGPPMARWWGKASTPEPGRPRPECGCPGPGGERACGWGTWCEPWSPADIHAATPPEVRR